MKKLILISLFFVFSSCKNIKFDYNKTIVGKYSSDNKKRTLIDFINSNYYYLNINLIVKKDKTFEIKTCSYTANGKWSISKDTFHYKYDTLIWTIDSLNYSNHYNKRKKKLIEYNRFLLIKDNYLFSKTKDGNKNLITKLIKR